MDRGGWWATVHGVAKSQTQLSMLKRSWASQVAQWSRIRLPMQETQETRARSLGQEDLLEKEMATHSGILAWEIPWTEEPDSLQSMAIQKCQTGLSN